MSKDPVCGMMVDEKTAQHKSNIEGKTVFLCSAGDAKRNLRAIPRNMVTKKKSLTMHN